MSQPLMNYHDKLVVRCTQAAGRAAVANIYQRQQRLMGTDAADDDQESAGNDDNQDADDDDLF